MHPLLSLLSQLPPETLVPAGWVRAQLEGESAPSTQVEGEVRIDLTVEQVAEKLGRASSTVRDWIRAGRLRAYRMRRREYRITSAALEEFLDGERRGDEPPGSRGKPARLDAWKDHLPTAS